MTTKLYFHTEPAGGVCLYRETMANGAQRVAHVPLEMSLDERDQRMLADEWLMSAQYPAPLTTMAVRRLVARHHVGRARAVADAVRESGSADLGMAMAAVRADG